MAFARRPTVLERLIVELGAKVDTSKLSEFEKATERVMEKADRAARVVMGIGAAATAALTAAAVAFSGVEAQLAEVAAKTGLSVEHLKDTYSEALRAIQRETGLADRQLLDALQKAISAGLEDQEAIDAVAESARAAAARIGDISDQVSAATTIMGAFEVSAGTALDVVARAAQVGEGETEDFANSLKGLGALGESIGLGLYDVAGGARGDLPERQERLRRRNAAQGLYRLHVGALAGRCEASGGSRAVVRGAPRDRGKRGPGADGRDAQARRGRRY